jgi:hypothetical protein
VLDFDHRFPPGPALTDQQQREAVSILLAADPAPDSALDAARHLAVRHSDVVQIRRVDRQICLSLARRGDSDRLVSNLLDRRSRAPLSKEEVEEIVNSYLTAHRFDIASPWAHFFEQLPPDQLPQIHQVHAILGRLYDAADIAERQGDPRAALRYLLQCPGTEAACRAVTISQERVRDPDLTIKAHQHAAEAFYREAKYSKAAEHFQQANDVLR